METYHEILERMKNAFYEEMCIRDRCDHVTKLFAVSQPELEAQVIRRTVEKMDVQDLQAFEKALRTKTQGNFSGGPQLAPVKKLEAETNRAFQI